jgi:hypothetical protein
MLRPAIKNGAQRQKAAAAPQVCSFPRAPSYNYLSAVAQASSSGSTPDVANPLNTSDHSSKGHRKTSWMSRDQTPRNGEVAGRTPTQSRRPRRNSVGVKLTNSGKKKAINPVVSDAVLSLHRGVLDALQKRKPLELLHALITASEDPVYLHSLRKTTIAEIFQALDPARFLAPLKAAYLDLGESCSVTHYYFDVIRPLSKIFAQYESLIRLLLTRWKNCGRKFGLMEYKLQLNVARVAGDRLGAHKIFSRSMVANHIKPDTDCCNYYLEARCWYSHHQRPKDLRKKATRRDLTPRQRQPPEDEEWLLLNGLHLKTGGIKEETMRIFTFMCKAGAGIDVNTYCMLILALGRDGDMEQIYVILQNVWEVDVDTAINGEDKDVRYDHDMRRSSPFYPDQNLLYTIAHVFAANNQLPSALRMVDVFARKYNIPIGPETWNQLLEWTYVLSGERSKANQHTDRVSSHLPLASVQGLWNTMVSAPYNVKPSILMYDHYVKNMIRRKRLSEVLQLMQAGREIHEDHNVLDRFEEKQDSRRFSAITSEAGLTFGAGTVLIEKQRRKEIRKLKNYRDTEMIRDWVQKVLRETDWFGSDRAMQSRYVTADIPKIIEKFWTYRPASGFTYEGLTCDIQIRSEDRGLFCSE